MTVETRKAEKDNLSRIIQISRVTQAEHADRLPRPFSAIGIPASKIFYDYIMKKKNRGVAVVATIGETIVGQPVLSRLIEEAHLQSVTEFRAQFWKGNDGSMALFGGLGFDQISSECQYQLAPARDGKHVGLVHKDQKVAHCV